MIRSGIITFHEAISAPYPSICSKRDRSITRRFCQDGSLTKPSISHLTSSIFKSYHHVPGTKHDTSKIALDQKRAENGPAGKKKQARQNHCNTFTFISDITWSTSPTRANASMVDAIACSPGVIPVLDMPRRTPSAPAASPARLRIAGRRGQNDVKMKKKKTRVNHINKTDNRIHREAND